ncbi:MAG: hypothetical protein PUD07_02630 [bacterium]|nr:hypothetical protein [bacterium]
MKKYNIFYEVKIVNIILIILGLGLTIFSVVSQGKLDYTSLIITILLILILLKDVVRYKNIKNNGKLIKNAKYKIVTLNNNKKVLRVEYKEKDKPIVLTGRITFKYIEDSGTTDLLVNKKDPNEFYAFGPSK